MRKSVTKVKTITPEQEALLGQPNSDQYPTDQELSADKNINNQSDLQENSEISSENDKKTPLSKTEPAKQEKVSEAKEPLLFIKQYG